MGLQDDNKKKARDAAVDLVKENGSRMEERNIYKSLEKKGFSTMDIMFGLMMIKDEYKKDNKSSVSVTRNQGYTFYDYRGARDGEKTSSAIGFE